MPINADKPHLWKADVERSIDFYNDWFLRFAPLAFRAQRAETTVQVADALEMTNFLRNISPENLQTNPGVLPTLRMICAPPIARDRLVGLAHLNKNLVLSMEGKPGIPPRMPPRMPKAEQIEQVQRISDTIVELADRDLFPWLEDTEEPTEEQITRAAMMVADRLCGAAADPIIRNAQEQRQLATIEAWLSNRGYMSVLPGSVDDILHLLPGSFAFRMNVHGGDGKDVVNVPVDCVIQPQTAKLGDVPLLIEAKSAGDATNTNKRRKEEAQKYRQLASRFGESVRYLLFLCGYFEPGYLGYEASEGIDWIWEHRLSDLDLLLHEPEESGSRVAEVQAIYTTPSGSKESLRFSRQKNIDEERTQLQRNRLGQFSTPIALARDIVKYAFSISVSGQEILFLEPALGTGVFFNALESHPLMGRINHATGVEVDSEYASAAASLWPRQPYEVINADFADFSKASDRRESYNLLCTNPPYVRHHHLSSKLKQELRQRVERELQLKPSGLSGLYVYFILLSHALLQSGGVASWLIPSEFLSVNYGRVLREYVLHHVTLKRIHQFDPTDVQFDDALVSSSIISYVKQAPTGPYEFEFSYGGIISEPTKIQTISSETLSSFNKWSYDGMGSRYDHERNGVRLGDIFDIKRGIATGSNGFFIIDQDIINEYNIPNRFLKPILPSPRYISEPVIRADARGFPKIPRARYLLDCNMSPDSLRTQYPDLWRYFELGESKGVPDGYLCANRKIWYLQEQRQPAMYMATYMVRSREKSANPFRFFLNLSQAIAANVFLLLYPKPVVIASIDGCEDRRLALLDILNGLTRGHVVRAGRTYGGGLHKLEPKELADLRLQDVPDWLRIEVQAELNLIW
ncbi:MAG: XamI family restriction endonuclease [Chloroflexi bacterium]|nr:XamI family restriction endonuclease [Chloroflexota bacterium]